MKPKGITRLKKLFRHYELKEGFGNEIQKKNSLRTAGQESQKDEESTR